MGITRFLLAGLFLGLPFGPIGIMCMGKTIEKGRKVGMIAISGAILVDIIYSIIAFLMLIPAKNFIEEHEFTLKIFIGIYLMIIGLTKVFGEVRITNIKEEDSSENSDEKIKNDNFHHEFLKIFFISLPNAFNIITIITLFTGLEIFRIDENFMIPKLIFGISVGCTSLWLCTTYILDKLRNKITERTMKVIVKICGVGIILFGIMLEVQALFL